MRIGTRQLIALSLIFLIVLFLSLYILLIKWNSIDLGYKIILLGLIINSGLLIIKVPCKHIKTLKNISLLKKKGTLINGIIIDIEEQKVGNITGKTFIFELDNKEIHTTPLMFNAPRVTVGEKISIYIDSTQNFIVHKIGKQI